MNDQYIAAARRRGQLSRLDYFTEYALRHGCSEADAYALARAAEGLIGAGRAVGMRELRGLLRTVQKEAA